MNLTVDALKGIYVALGGSADDVKNVTLIPDMLEKIAVYAEAAAAELPAVKAADNGKVLTVVSGKWSKADVVTTLDVTIAGDNSVTLPSGYNFTKIKGLIDAGIEVKLMDGSNHVYSLIGNASGGISFGTFVTVSGTRVDFYKISISSSGATLSTLAITGE